MGGPTYTLGMSNLNVSAADALRFGAEDYVGFMRGAGYDPMRSLEVTPTRIPGMMEAMGELAAWGTVGSLHESWREAEVGDVGRLIMTGRWGRAIGEAAVVAGMPLLDESYAPLLQVQDRARGVRFPLIVHPHTQTLGDRPPRRPRGQVPPDVFGPIRVQLTAEDVAAYDPSVLDAGIDELADTIERINRLRKTEVVADLHHVFRERDGKNFGSEAHIITLLRTLHERGLIREWQLAFRPDFGGPKSDLQKAADGRLADTPQGRTLTAIKDVLTEEPLHIISEVRSSSIGSLDLPRRTSYRTVHRKLTDSARALLAA